MKTIITDKIQGVIESISGEQRAYSVDVNYLISVAPFTVAPESNNSFIEHKAHVTFTVKVLAQPKWTDVRFHDSEAFLSRRKADIAETPDIAGSAADYQDENDSKAAVASVWATHDKPDQRARVIGLLLKNGGLS